MAKKKEQRNCLIGITQAVSWPSEDNPNPEHKVWGSPVAVVDACDWVFWMPSFTGSNGAYDYWGWSPA